LPVTGKFYSQISSQKLKDWMEFEGKLANVDRIVKETNDRRNELETFVYDMRGKLDTTHTDFMSESDKEAFLSQLDDVQQWLYDEGESANKTAYAQKMLELKKVADPMLSRFWESEQRPHRFDVLKKLVNTYQQFVDSTDEKYTHIGPEDRDIVRKAAAEIDVWMVDKMVHQDKLKHHETPVVSCSEIDGKYRELANKCQPVLTKPKPEPPKPEPPKETPNAEPQAGAKKEDEKNPNDDKTGGVEQEKASNGNKENQQQVPTEAAETIPKSTEPQEPPKHENNTSDKTTEENSKG